MKFRSLLKAGALSLAVASLSVQAAVAQSFIGTIAAGSFYGNSTAAEAKPKGATASQMFDRAFGSTNGMIPYRTGGVWGTIQTGTSGAAIPRLDTANTFGAAQTVLSTTNPQLAASNGVSEAACIQVNGPAHTTQLCDATSGVLKTVTNDEMLIGTNNIVRWHYATTGGYYADGITGGDKGAGTLNTTGLFVNGTASPSSAAGQSGLFGTIAVPTLTNTGQAYVFNTLGNGLNLQGDGSGNDIVLLNKGGTGVCAIATGGSTFNCLNLTLTTPLPAGSGGTGIASLGTGVATALGVNTGSAGAFVVNGGALGTPSSGVATNLTSIPAANLTGNVPDANMPNTAWGTFTPSFSCGTASITSNSARFKTWGKITHIQIEFTFTAIGTCTTTVSFNLPNTAQSAGGLVGREITSSGKGLTCAFSASGTTAVCNIADLTAFTSTSHGQASGAYENQ